MKKTLFIIAFFVGFGIYAQDTKTKYEQEGDLLKATYYHDNGEIAQIGYFLNGKLHGEWQMYDENGAKLAKGSYVSGQKTGKWYFWEGEHLSEVDFVDSKIAHVKKLNAKDPVVTNKS
ncbi:nicotinic acid mononucleotide adenyltransferase [Arenibacter sp. GZD96]|uniref:toxin-antitoxin system YwqK family antitoxin n=1 Tax=Aurantibrevibacter litoralis TaxID=3106030 RepID=UPI002AFF1613|nr:hypothetical protein [Arenibacter sp. GZD-96]MEA1786643.1 nicotinic acid mononucleotide adenyltransferase [Arenibacter sp. GZD-96]